MLDAVAAVAAALLLAVGAGAVACALGVRDAAAFPPAALVVAAAAVVAQTIVLSLAGALTRAGLLGAGALTAAGAAAAWVRAGRPAPPRYRARAGSLGVALRRHPEVALLVAVAGGAVAFQGFMAVAVAPSNWDSMTYHLSRAAYWLQYHSATPYPGGSVRQLSSPPNGEILQAWTLAVARTDRLAALVQWLSLAGVASCVYLGARLLRFGAAPALFAAALFAVLPQPLLQATSTQNDLIAAFFVLACAVFGVRGLRERRAGDLAVAALAAGLAVGTKGTTLALAPALAIIFAAEAWRARPPRRLALGGVGAAAASIIALGTWGYAQNVAHEGSPFGGLAGATRRQSAVVPNAVWSLWTFVDSPGVRVPVLGTLFPRAAHKLGQRFESATYRFRVDTDVSEDTSAYGIVGWLALLPVLLFYAVRRRAGPRRVWAAAGLVGLAAFATTFEFNQWVGRLLLPTVALAAPLLAGLAARRAVAIMAIVAAIVVIPPCLRSNPNKPLGVGANALSRDRIAQMTAVRPEMDTVLRSVRARFGDRAPLAFVGGEDSWDYPLFGEHRQRHVVRFAGRADPRGLRASGVRGVLFANVRRPGPEFHPQRIGPGYWLAAAR